jgi:rod shape-determining protein MreB
MLEALEEPAKDIIDTVLTVLENTPPELSSDISDRGIVMTGGGSLIYGLDKLIQQHTKINVLVAEDAVSCVAKGTGQSLKYIDILAQNGFMNYSNNIK